MFLNSCVYYSSNTRLFHLTHSISTSTSKTLRQWLKSNNMHQHKHQHSCITLKGKQSWHRPTSDTHARQHREDHYSVRFALALIDTHSASLTVSMTLKGQPIAIVLKVAHNKLCVVVSPKVSQFHSVMCRFPDSQIAKVCHDSWSWPEFILKCQPGEMSCEILYKSWNLVYFSERAVYSKRSPPHPAAGYVLIINSGRKLHIEHTVKPVFATTWEIGTT